MSELDYVTDDGDAIRIGALVRHIAFEQPIVDGPLGRLLGLAVHHVGHFPIRIRGTFGGSLAHADPAAEWCVIARLLDAEMVARDASGDRRIPAADFFQTVFTTALEPDELLVEARLGVEGVRELALTPLVLDSSGHPRLAGPEDAARILGEVSDMSAEYGTVIELEGGRGMVGLEEKAALSMQKE